MKLTTILYRLFMFLWRLSPFKKYQALLLRNAHLVPDKIKMDLGFTGIFSVKSGAQRIRFYATPNDKSALALFWYGLESGWDGMSIQVWSALAKRSKVILDIGANIGIYALAARYANTTALVHAFEPSARMFNMLKKNIDVNLPVASGIQLHNLALSDHEGILKFFDLDNPTAVGSLVLNEHLKDNPLLISYEVPVLTGTQWFHKQELTQLDLVSIDVEMHEPEVLEGLKDLMAKFTPDFIIEVLNEELAHKIEAYFEGYGYLYFRIDEKAGLIPSEKLWMDTETKSGYNYLVIKPSSVEIVNSFMVVNV